MDGNITISKGTGITLGGVVALVTFLFYGFGFYNGMDKRIFAVETKLESNSNRITKIDEKTDNNSELISGFTMMLVKVMDDYEIVKKTNSKKENDKGYYRNSR